MVDVVTTVAAVYLGANGLLYVFQRRLVFVPLGRPGTPAEAGVPDMTPVRYATGDGLILESWFKPPAGRPTIVYFHGNAGHFADRAFKARYFMDRGYGFLLASYRGYAGNPGRPTEAKVYLDAHAALDFLEAQSIPAEEIVIYGESLGTGVATAVASERAAGALVLEAPFTSVADVAGYRFWWTPARWLVHDRFDSLSRIARIGMPLLILHGDRDWQVPLRLGKRLFAAAVEPKEFVLLPGAGHSNIYDYGGAAAIEDFLERRFARSLETVASRPRKRDT